MHLLTRMATVGTDMELNDLLDFSLVSRRHCSSVFNKRLNIYFVSSNYYYFYFF
uniref:Uncharacterized protein n=1 Tax=Cyprinus carpio TaxID=7962 RepID=A0A8C2PYA6_CYPCA